MPGLNAKPALLRSPATAHTPTLLACVLSLPPPPPPPLLPPSRSSVGRGHSYIVWVHNAFGPALALLNGMVNLLCNVFDCALYKLLLAQYVERAPYPLLPPEPHVAHGASWWRELAPDVIGSCLRLAVVALAAGVNVLGTSVVGIGMVAFMFLVSPPLLALVLASYAAPHTAPLAPFTPSLQEPPTTAAQWHFLLALVMWNNCGYVSAGMVASFGRQVLTTALRPLHTGTTRRAWSPPRSRTRRVPSRAT